MYCICEIVQIVLHFMLLLKYMYSYIPLVVLQHTLHVAVGHTDRPQAAGL